MTVKEWFKTTGMTAFFGAIWGGVIGVVMSSIMGLTSWQSIIMTLIDEAIGAVIGNHIEYLNLKERAEKEASEG